MSREKNFNLLAAIDSIGTKVLADPEIISRSGEGAMREAFSTAVRSGLLEALQPSWRDRVAVRTDEKIALVTSMDDAQTHALIEAINAGMKQPPHPAKAAVKTIVQTAAQDYVNTELRVASVSDKTQCYSHLV